MLGHASFLAMTAFAVSYRTVVQIPKYPPGAFLQLLLLISKLFELSVF